MQLRILGAHNMESRDTRAESHLLDGVLALDAGSITRALSFEEQRGIRAIILSHRHFDHVHDLLPLALPLMDTDLTIDVYAIQDTVDFVKSKLLDGSLYPDFTSFPSPESPTLRLNVVDLYTEFEVLGYTVLPVPVPHAVPAAGFQLSAGGIKLFYTGDTGEGLDKAWAHVSPDVLLTEVTYGNEALAKAREVGHLTPGLLEDALTSFDRQRGYLPRVIVSHMNPFWEESVRQELKLLSEKLNVEILVSDADMTISL